MASETDPSKALGHAFTHAPQLYPHHFRAVLAASGVTGDHSGITHPIQISVPPREIVSGETGLTVEQQAARLILDRTAGTPHGDMFREDNSHLLK